jgi:hypothetical protein
LVLALSWTSLSATVAADCMASSAFLSPPPGAALPPSPVLYLFVPEHLPNPDVRVTSGSSVVKVKVEEVSKNDTFKVLELAVARDAAGQLKIVASGVKNKTDYGSFAHADGEYTIDPAWKPPADKVVEIKSLTRESKGFTCSHNATYNLRPSTPAIAYRLEYAKSYDDWSAGKRKSAIHPPSLRQFFDPDSAPGEAVIKLGHAMCLYETFRWPSAYVYAGLVALHPDGSETPAEKVPAEVPWKFEGLIFGAMTPAFYKEVHGYPMPGTPEAIAAEEAKQKQAKAKGEQPGSKGSGPSDDAPRTRDCSMTRAPGSPWAWLALLATALLWLLRLRPTSRGEDDS